VAGMQATNEVGEGHTATNEMFMQLRGIV